MRSKPAMGMTKSQLADALTPRTAADRRRLMALTLRQLEARYLHYVWETYQTTAQMVLGANRSWSVLSDHWEAIGLPRTDGVPPGTRRGRT